MSLRAPGHIARRPGISLMVPAIVGLILIGSTIALAQGGSIKGKVVADIPDQRKALAGVIVALSGERLSGKKVQSISDEEGRYDFTGLIAGDYQLSVELTGFKK